MIDLENIQQYTTPRPDGWTLFGNGELFDAFPQTHQEQILFLDKAASAYIWSFSYAARLITGGGWAPFEKGNFKQVDTFDDFRRDEASKDLLKKWLYQRGIAFDTWVFMLEESNKQAVLTTWKMIIKYDADLFIMPNVMVFDKTRNWCLFFYHEDRLFFGRDNIYDATADLNRMEAWNGRKKKFPQYKHPYL